MAIIVLVSCGESSVSNQIPDSAAKIESVQVTENDKYIKQDKDAELSHFLENTDTKRSLILGRDSDTCFDTLTFSHDYSVTEITATKETHDGFVMLTSVSKDTETKTKSVNLKLSSLLKGNYVLTEVVINYNEVPLKLSCVPYIYEDFRIRTKNDIVINEEASINTLYLDPNSSFCENKDGSFSYFVYFENCSICITTTDRLAAEGFIHDEIS